VRKIDLTNFQVATSETARQINRRIALSFLRRHHPMSRADLARRLGLQRSTVSAIVDQLIDEGWVMEGAIGRVAARGRRPRFLHLNVERAGIIGVDLRPETTTVGLADVDARFVAHTSWPTPRGPANFVRELARTIASLRSAHPRIVCEGIGVSLPGRVAPSGRLMFAPNLGWPQVDLKQAIEHATELPVAIENAANACALSELWFGRYPDNIRHLVGVTVSEGIGVGLLLNGQLVHGADAMAGEFGHVVIDDRGPLCSCGRRGCWERFASNSAAIQYYVDRTQERATSSNVARPRFEGLIALADGGDTLAVEALERMGRFLGMGIAGLATGLAPEVIVIIGDVTAAWDRVGPILTDEFERRALPLTTTRIVPTDRASQPRLRGAVTLMVQHHFGAPTVA
jgi:predicted NBD/HSP70 family sugar kinase/DNA-binding XRE family transcriptional regulator